MIKPVHNMGENKIYVFLKDHLISMINLKYQCSIIIIKTFKLEKDKIEAQNLANLLDQVEPEDIDEDEVELLQINQLQMKAKEFLKKDKEVQQGLADP